MALCVCVCVWGGGGGSDTHTHTPTHFARTQGSLPYLVHCNCFVAYTRRLHCIIDLCRYTPLNGSIEHMPPPPLLSLTHRTLHMEDGRSSLCSGDSVGTFVLCVHAWARVGG
eukprot:jgi/Botrbrau1/10163/Bobra.0121s0015.1